VRVVVESVDELLHVLVHERVREDDVGELVQLRLRRQLAVEQQVGDLQEAAPVGELVDG